MRNEPIEVMVGDYLTLDGAAQALGLTYWRVYRYVRTHEIPVKRLGHSLLVRLEDLHGLVEHTGK